MSAATAAAENLRAAQRLIEASKHLVVHISSATSVEQMADRITCGVKP